MLFFLIVISVVIVVFLHVAFDDAALAEPKSISDTDIYKILIGNDTSDKKTNPSLPMDVPLIQQLPELPRGCEVTSLAMLLSSAGVSVDKMQLANEVKKDSTPYKKVNGQVFFGNPNTGFVGSMEDKGEPGLGVYHGPIFQLAKRYLPTVVDLTGEPFEKIENQLNTGHAVWVIVAINFKKVPVSFWSTWQTPSGKIRITKKEHSVLLTGYDEKYIFINDPLSTTKNKKVLKTDFIQSWKQFGSQAISY